MSTSFVAGRFRTTTLTRWLASMKGVAPAPAADPLLSSLMRSICAANEFADEVGGGIVAGDSPGGAPADDAEAIDRPLVRRRPAEAVDERGASQLSLLRRLLPLEGVRREERRVTFSLVLLPLGLAL
jgi:hypothetical protein